MQLERLATGGPDYEVFRFGRTKRAMRGPQPDFSTPYIAFIGGTETFGRFVMRPFTTQLAEATGLGAANFGAVNGGVDLFLSDPEVLAACAAGRFCVVGVMGAHNMSNRFYAVHPRRNDRFVRASNTLKAIYPEVDFTEIHFSRHLLTTLRATDSIRFAAVVEELRTAWVARMKTLCDLAGGRIVLLWVAEGPPPARDYWQEQGGGLGPDPLFIDREMLAELDAHVLHRIEVVTSRAARATGTDGMMFAPHEERAARCTPGPLAHREIADALLARVEELAR